MKDHEIDLTCLIKPKWDQHKRERRMVLLASALYILVATLFLYTAYRLLRTWLTLLA